MSIKIVLLRSGEQIISDVHEVIGEEEKAIAYSLTRPCTVHMERMKSEDLIINGEPAPVDISLYPWISFSKNEYIVVPMDWPVSFADPIDQLEELYTNKVLNSLKVNKDDQNVSVDEQPNSSIAD